VADCIPLIVHATARPTVTLPEVYATIAYYLTHRDTIDAYLAQRRASAEELRRTIEAKPNYKELRDRLLAGARASWITFALVLLFSGWELLGVKRLAGVFAFGALSLGLLTATVPQVRERIVRTTYALAADQEGGEGVVLADHHRIERRLARRQRAPALNVDEAAGLVLAHPAVLHLQVEQPAVERQLRRDAHAHRQRVDERADHLLVAGQLRLADRHQVVYC
jgi:hypothetical protein